MPRGIEIEIESKGDSYPEFKIPDGLDLSELEEGDEKEVLTKIKKKPDGMICVVEVEGIPLKHREDDTSEDNEDETTDEIEDDFSADSDYPSQLMSRAQAGGLM